MVVCNFASRNADIPTAENVYTINGPSHIHKLESFCVCDTLSALNLISASLAWMTLYCKWSAHKTNHLHTMFPIRNRYECLPIDNDNSINLGLIRWMRCLTYIRTYAFIASFAMLYMTLCVALSHSHCRSCRILATHFFVHFDKLSWINGRINT